MKITSMGYTVLRRRAKHTFQRWRNEASKHQKRLYLVVARHFLELWWCPWDGGYAVVSEGVLADFPKRTHTYPRVKKLSMKRKEALGLKGVAMPGPAPVSTLLAKLPAIREYCSLTEYEDKTIRAVSALRITSRGTSWHVTLTDPDACARLCTSDASLDKALLLMEQLLGVPEAPWEPDQFEIEKKEKRRKK